MFRFFIASAVVLATATFACSQEIKIETPKEWRGETIKLPAPFAPDMKLKGIEEIRFAPGMFKKDKDDFFSYVFVFQVEENQSLGKSVLESELMAYYQGLCKSVLGDDADKVDVEQFKITIEAAKGDASNKNSERVSYSGRLEWVEPFVTKKKQTLRLELDVWEDAKTKRPMMFASVSPAKDQTNIWKQMRAIRDKVVSESLKQE